MSRVLILVSALALVLGVGWLVFQPAPGVIAAEENAPPVDTTGLERAYFAGGCFWCTESDFESVDGVVDAISGYAGGHVDNPTYEQVSAGGTGHAESIEVLYDPAKVTYEELLDVFWHSVDPTDAGGQFCDRGESYTTAIYTNSMEQQKEATASAKEIGKELGKPVATLIAPAKTFYPAEDYHQNYYEKNPIRYKYYRFGCRRDNARWGAKVGARHAQAREGPSRFSSEVIAVAGVFDAVRRQHAETRKLRSPELGGTQ